MPIFVYVPELLGKEDPFINGTRAIVEVYFQTPGRNLNPDSEANTRYVLVLIFVLQ